MDYCVVLITAPKGKEPKKLAELLLKKKLCACVNIIPSVVSFFWWQARIDRAAESLLLVKTKKSHLPRLIKAVKAAHSYSVCEVIALPIIAGNKDYLDWIDAETKKG
jgi:periplasmic divalent cation tolerance protein